MPEDIVGRILRLVGYGAYRWRFDEVDSTLTIWVREAASEPRYTCSGCGIGVRAVHSVRERRMRDLPWGTWKVWLVVEVHRVYCPRCGVCGERIDFLEGKHPYTRRFAEAVARDCEDAAIRRVATKWGLSAQTVRRIDKRALVAWSQRRKRQPLRLIGVDEIFWGKGRCLTVVSDLEAGEPIWAGPERKRETLDRFFTKYLGVRRLRQHLPRAAIVFDKFHVMKHVNAAIDETRRQEFFRQPGPRRAVMRGKRWLLLTRWHNLTGAKKTQLQEALSLNRRLFKAYYLKEQIERLWSYTYEGAAMTFLGDWLASLRWQRLPAFKKLAGALLRHLDGILAYCKHKVPFGVVEAIQRQSPSLDPPRSRLPRPPVPNPQGSEEHRSSSTRQGCMTLPTTHDFWHRPGNSRFRRAVGGRVSKTVAHRSCAFELGFRSGYFRGPDQRWRGRKHDRRIVGRRGRRFHLAELADRFGSIKEQRAVCVGFCDGYNRRHCYSGLAWFTPATGALRSDRGGNPVPRCCLDGSLRGASRALRAPRPTTGRAADHGLDQPVEVDGRQRRPTAVMRSVSTVDTFRIVNTGPRWKSLS
jgi:transposase